MRLVLRGFDICAAERLRWLRRRARLAYTDGCRGRLDRHRRRLMMKLHIVISRLSTPTIRYTYRRTITDPACCKMVAAMTIVLDGLGPGLAVRRARHVVVELLQFHGRGGAVAAFG